MISVKQLTAMIVLNNMALFNRLLLVYCSNYVAITLSLTCL